jgi:hypothetical protein
MAGQVTTGVLIYTYLRDGLDRGLKNRDPKYINWKQKCDWNTFLEYGGV